MKPSVLLRFTGLTLGGMVFIHLVVWGMERLLSVPGESSTLNGGHWWTFASMQLSVLVQVRAIAGPALPQAR